MAEQEDDRIFSAQDVAEFAKEIAVFTLSNQHLHRGELMAHIEREVAFLDGDGSYEFYTKPEKIENTVGRVKFFNWSLEAAYYKGEITEANQYSFYKTPDGYELAFYQGDKMLGEAGGQSFIYKNGTQAKRDISKLKNLGLVQTLKKESYASK